MKTQEEKNQMAERRMRAEEAETENYHCPICGESAIFDECNDEGLCAACEATHRCKH